MLGFSSVSETPISSLYANVITENSANANTIVQVISTGYGRFIVIGNGSTIIQITSASYTEHHCVPISATADASTYVFRDRNGNRVTVNNNPSLGSQADYDVHIRKRC